MGTSASIDLDEGLYYLLFVQHVVIEHFSNPCALPPIFARHDGLDGAPTFAHLRVQDLPTRSHTKRSDAQP